MADEQLHITVSYSGREKRIPLVVRPSIELSDSEVDQAEFELGGIVRHVFNVPAEAGFSLHEAETDRTLTKESFRDPSYIQAFPKFWYLTVEKTAAETGEEEEEAAGDKVIDLYSEGFSDLDESLPSLAELSRVETKYRNMRLTAEPSGLFGVTLRYFSIRPVSGPERADSPSEQPMFGGDSQNSQLSSGSVDVLSTTFVHEVEGAGLEAGLSRGDTVHMINGESIIRSSFTEIQDLLAQCGSEITLMVLPKEQDDLQFIYPQYTEGTVGEYNSGDERVIARDIPIVVGTGASSPVDGEGGPLSLYHFNGSGSSLDHTHYNSSNEQLHTAADDPLINCPIHEIPVHSPTTSSFAWSSGRGTGSNSQLDRLVEEEPVANGDMRYDYRSGEEAIVDPSWYQDPPDMEDNVSSQPGKVGKKDVVVRAHSQDSAVPHRIQSMSGEEGPHSQPMWAEDLGVVKISRRSDKSLEMLTSLSTAPQPPRGMRRIQSDDVIGKRAQTCNNVEQELGMRRHSEQNADPNRTPTATMPPDNYQRGVSLLPASKPGTGTRTRRSTRSYSSQHEQLHKSRSRLGDSEAAAKRAESLRKQFSQPTVQEAEEEDSKHERIHSDTVHSLSPLQGGDSEGEEEGRSPDQHVTTPTIQDEHAGDGGRGERGRGRGRGGGSHTLRHRKVSPPPSPSRFQSATIDPRTSRSLAAGPVDRSHMRYLLAMPIEPSRRLPIAKTTSAQTTYGKEVNIDEVVELRASQNVSSSLSVQPRPSHMDSEGDLAGQGVGLFPPHPSYRRHSLTYYEGMSSTNKDVPCHGLLCKKQVSDGQGKRGGARSWKPFYTVLAGSHMVFYKDKRDADANKPCDEPPLEVVPGRADLTHGYTKRKFVFRVICGQRAEYLMQCEDSESMLHWVTAILRLNGGGKMVVQSPKADQMLTPGSPVSGRRGSSPAATGASQRSTRKRGSGIVSNLRNVLRTKKGSSSQPSFQQLLADCPMSSENKCVPLVVELCVREVEEHGLDIEGLYRKPGQSSVIRNMVAEIDKGQFEFDEYGDIHTIGSLLKKFFQELPDSLIPGDRYKEFLEVIRDGQGEMQQVTRLRGLVFHLPMAHYHTLRYLIRHLNTVAEHAEWNKMVLRNVAMVFGPTLMLRSSPAEEFDFVAMNNTFTVIELLCKHWLNIFDSEMCHEEQALAREREREKQMEAQREVEGGGLGPAQRTSSDPAVNTLKVKKDHALLNASPKMVRRIKNQFSSSSQRKTLDRNSYAGGEVLPSNSFSRKQHNRSDTLPPTFLSPQGSLLSPANPSPASKWGRAGSSGTLQSVRHHEAEGYGGDLNPHTRYAHCGGREEGRREHAGSIWKKDQQKGRGSGRDHVEKREGQSRSQILSSHPPPPPIAHQRELLTSYQQPSLSHAPSHRHSHSSPSHEHLHRSTTVPVSSDHRSSQPQPIRPPTSSHAPSSPGMRRKISYNLAVGEGFQHQPRSHGSRYHQQAHRKSSMDSLPFTDDFREKELSHSYAPQSTSRSTNLSKSGMYPGRQSAARGYQSYGPQRGESVQRSRHNESYH